MRSHSTASPLSRRTHRKELGPKFGSLLLPLRVRGHRGLVDWGATNMMTYTIAPTDMMTSINTQTKSKLALSASAICRCVA